MHYFYNKKKISHICIWGSILLFLCIYIKIIINVNQNSYSPEIVTHKINEEEFKDNDTSIIISLYPHKNVIYLNKE